VDRHVHLGLVDAEALRTSPVLEVHDLGWDPAGIADLAARLRPEVRVRYAGPFHTAVGGYPAGRSWAPAAAVREVTGPADARAAVTTTYAAGGFAVKIALHAGMPLLDDESLAGLVSAAREVGLPVVVHAEGDGQAARAIAIGADALAHTPWTERLTDAVVQAAAGRGMRWISTLAIHRDRDLAVAIDNARRFVAAGGDLRYGTDLGNGPAPAGVNDAEILLLGECGLAGEALIRAVCGSATASGASRAIENDEPMPVDAAGLVAWLATARRAASPSEGKEQP
jgi:imidazolonepropionase-like amidohydrolase